MVYRRMRSWSVVPQTTSRMTYIVPMTAAASTTQMAMMENKNRLMTRAEKILDDAHDKAENAFEMASDAHAKLSSSIHVIQGITFLIVACFVVLFLIQQRLHS